jgi:hypothetical protein
MREFFLFIFIIFSLTSCTNIEDLMENNNLSSSNNFEILPNVMAEINEIKQITI